MRVCTASASLPHNHSLSGYASKGVHNAYSAYTNIANALVKQTPYSSANTHVSFSANLITKTTKFRNKITLTDLNHLREIPDRRTQAPKAC